MMGTPDGDTDEIVVFYDGNCRICVRSAELFKKYDNGRGIVRCIDFHACPDAESLSGVSREALGTSLHARMPDSSILRGPEAIRAVLEALDHGWKARWTQWAIIKPIADRCYSLFARHRLRFFKINHACDGSCKIR